MNKETGNLYIVATPIGHLGDLSHRAVAVLNAVDYIAAEDTRHSKTLLAYYGIQKPLLAYHNHNESSASERFVDKLQQGENVALISDAGTPLISDPGHYLVQKVIAAGLTIIPIPGPCAVATALCVAGLPCNHYQFVGFLPVKSHARQRALLTHLSSPMTTVLFESTHRIHSLLALLSTQASDREIVVAKEMTKTYEHFFRGRPIDILDHFSQEPKLQKGEFVVLIAGATTTETDDYESVLIPLLAELPLTQAVRLTTTITGQSKNTVYQRALVLREKSVR